MRKQILTSFITLCSIFTMNAQNWNGSTNVDGNIWRNGNVGIGTSSPAYKISLGGQIGQVTTPLGLAFSNDYSNNSLAVNSKLFLYNTGGTEIYGIGVGSNADIQYHAGSTGNIYGRHDFYSGNNLKMTILNNGNVGIGTTSPTYKLDVCGTIRAKEVKVDLLGTCVPDFVFKKDYKLMSLNELEKFVTTNQHLPEIAPEKEMIENGLNMKEFQMKLLQKMEEMTLYIIEQNKKNEKQEQELKLLKAEIKKIKSAKK